ncbi:hypothetical protein D3C71_1739080 [compost metagenome]
MQATPAAPHQTARGSRDVAAFFCAASVPWSLSGKPINAKMAPAAMTAAKTWKSIAPPRVATRWVVPAMKMIPNTPRAIPTTANSRWGFALLAIVPCVTLKAAPAATPATTWRIASKPKPVVFDATANPRAANPKPIDATQRPTSRWKIGARKRLAPTAPARKSVASRPAC